MRVNLRVWYKGLIQNQEIYIFVPQDCFVVLMKWLVILLLGRFIDIRLTCT